MSYDATQPETSHELPNLTESTLIGLGMVAVGVGFNAAGPEAPIGHLIGIMGTGAFAFGAYRLHRREKAMRAQPETEQFS